MKKNFLQSYTSDTSMISSGIFLSLVGVFTHQIGWILFGVPVSLIYLGSWIYTRKKGKENKKLFGGMLMVLVLISATVLMIHMIKMQETLMVVLSAIALLFTGYAFIHLIRQK